MENKKLKNNKKNPQKGKQQNHKHNLTLKNRKKINIKGIKEVISYNESRILLDTMMGALTIKGENLNIQKLDLEDHKIDIQGDNINSLEYTGKKHDENLLKRIFK